MGTGGVRVFVSWSLEEVSGAVCNPLILPPVSLPLFLFLIHRHSTRSKSHHQQQTTDDRGGLEEVVLKEIVHGLIGRDVPESIEVDIDNHEPQDEGQRC